MKYIFVTIFIIVNYTFASDNNITMDNKQTCLAISNKNVKYCNSIQNYDNKSFCFGIVKQDTGYCNMIKDEDLKNQCLAIALNDIKNCDKIQDKNTTENCKVLYNKIDSDFYQKEECNS